MIFRFRFNIFNRQVFITKNSCHLPDDITKTEFWKQTIKGAKFDAHWQLEDEMSSQSDSDCMIVDETPAPEEGPLQENMETIDPEAKFYLQYSFFFQRYRISVVVISNTL